MAQDRVFVTHSLPARREHCVSLHAIISCDTKAGICSFMELSQHNQISQHPAEQHTEENALCDISSLLKQIMRDKGLKTTQVNESKSPFSQWFRLYVTQIHGTLYMQVTSGKWVSSVDIEGSPWQWYCHMKEQ